MKKIIMKNPDKLSKRIIVVLLLIIILITSFITYSFIKTKYYKKGYTSIFGYAYFIVDSNSMAPKINKNDLVIIKEKSKYKEKNIITYKENDNYITHRITRIEGNRLVTKGDANNNLDKIVYKKDVIGKLVLIIPNVGLIKKIIISPKVLEILLLTLLIISITTSYKTKNIRTKVKKPIKGLNPNVYINKNITKNIDKKRFKGMLMVDLLVIILLLLIKSIPITLSRYDSEAIGKTSTNIAFYLLKPDYVTNNIKLTSLTPSDTPYIYTFSISNYDAVSTSEVDLEYILKIVTTTNLPLTYKLYQNEDYTSNTSTNLVTNNNTTIEQDDDDTYFKNITLSKEEMYYSTPKTNNYTLLIYYTRESANAKYQNTIESIRIIIDSNQIVDN